MKKSQAKRIFAQLWALRDIWTPKWKELAEFMAPLRGAFDDGERTQYAKKMDAKKIIDSTPLKAVKTLGAGMMGGLTSPSLRWFFLRTKAANQDPGGPAARWLQQTQEILENVLDSAGVYNALHNFYQEIGVFGTAAFLLEEDERTVVRAVPMTIGEYAIDTDEKGKPCRMARKLRMSVWQLRETFGEENLPARVREQLEAKKYDQTYAVCHLITPNDGRDAAKADKRNMPWISLYWMEGTGEEFLREGGYEEFPLICARWDVKNDTQVYGKGPGWETLGDVKMLQKLQRSKLYSVDLLNNPPVAVSAAVPGLPDLRPGGITRYNNATDPGIKAVYQTPLDLNSLEKVIYETQTRINAMYYVDLFLMLSGVDAGKMTATEVQARTQEKMMVLGPVLQRLKEELLDPLLSRAFQICWRMGILPPPPDNISNLDIEYVSVIAQAQKNASVQTITQGITLAQTWAQTDPSVLDFVDFGAALREAYKAMGAPADMLRPEEEVNQMRQERAQQQAQTAQMQQAQALMQGAKTLSDTQLGTGSALDAVAQAMRGGQ